MRAASRGSSSFHGIAKQGPDPIRIWRFDTPGLERVLNLDLTLCKGPDIPVEIRRTIGPQPLQSSGEPALETGADCRELPFDGDLGEVIHGDAECFRGSLEVAERFLAVEMKSEGRATHGCSLHASSVEVVGFIDLGLCAVVLG